MTTKHTPGPWIAVDAGIGPDDVSPLFAILGPEDQEGRREQIATVNCEEAGANAALIKSVPDLLKACKAMIATHRVGPDGPRVTGDWLGARASVVSAVAKAEPQP